MDLIYFRAVESTSRKGQKTHILFTFKHMSKDTYGFTVDGYSLSELLEFGLIDKLNNFFDYKNSNISVTYEEQKDVEGFTNIIINW